MLGQATQGIKNAKPRLKTAKEALSRLSKEYLEIRNRQMRAKALMAEIQAAHARGQLLERKLVEFQASYLLIAMRQRILSLPSAYGPRLVGMEDAHSAGEVLREAALGLLDDLKDFPERVVDPNWLETLDENGEKPGPPSEQQGKPLRKRPRTAESGRRKPAATS